MLYQLSYASLVERETGIGPATNSLEGCDSTTELLPRRNPLYQEAGLWATRAAASADRSPPPKRGRSHVDRISPSSPFSITCGLRRHRQPPAAGHPNAILESEEPIRSLSLPRPELLCLARHFHSTNELHTAPIVLFRSPPAATNPNPRRRTHRQ